MRIALVLVLLISLLSAVYSQVNVFVRGSHLLDSMVVFKVVEPNNTLTKTEKQAYVYTESGLLQVCTSYTWNEGSSNWDLSSKFETNYENGFVKDYAYYSFVTGKWVGDFKYEYAFNSDLSSSNYINYIWNSSTNDWIPTSAWTASYNANGNQIDHVSKVWNSELNKWQFSNKWDKAFDKQGNVVLYSTSTYDQSLSVWQDSLMCVFDYDENSRLLSKVDYIYEPSISDWIGLAKVEKVYDSLGRLSDNLSWTWLHDNWAGNLKTTFLYDESTKTVKETSTSIWKNDVWTNFEKSVNTPIDNTSQKVVSYTWSANLGLWINQYNWFSTFNSSGDVVECITQKWNAYHNKWFNDIKLVQDYKGQNPPIITTYLWANDEDQWREEFRYNYSSTESNSLSQYSAWSSSHAQWKVMNSETTISFVGNKSTFEKQYRESISSNLVGLKDEYRYADLLHVQTSRFAATDDGWVENLRSFYYYKEEVSDTIPKFVGVLAVFPNPATDVLTINAFDNSKTNSVTIAQLNGIVVLKEVMLENNRIDISQLARGIYILTLKQDDVKFVSKFVKM